MSNIKIREEMTMKIIAVIILCTIIVVQWVLGIMGSLKKKLGCFGIVTFTIWTMFLFVLLYFGGLFDF